MQKRLAATRNIAALAAILALPSLVHAQMPSQQSAATKSNASAPADPHNLSGMWEFFMGIPGQGIYATPSKDHPPMTPWAQARYDVAKPGYGPKAQAGGNDPILKCNPAGIPRILFFPQPFEIVQSPERAFMFFEREHEWRQIWMDGRSHSKDVAATWMGDSIGKWEGDTFVITTKGFRESEWLDTAGNPITSAATMTERITRPDFGTLNLAITIDDPKAYTKPFTIDMNMKIMIDTQMIEEFCLENERDSSRLFAPGGGK
jgi:hypothetical protein